jgi:phage terminase large subunit-like protein
MAGLALDPWEEHVLCESLGERPDGRWAAFEVGLVVPRQNGKGTILEARELAGLFLLDERLIIHSAHQFDTSIEHFRRLLTLIEETPDFDRRVKRVSRSHGEEGIELRNGQRIRFRTRTKGGGRGFTGDLLVLDEAMELAEAFHGALLPTLSARSVVGNPQVWYTASAVDQLIHENGIVLARIRERGLRGNDPSLAYFEWSLGSPTPDEIPVEDLDDPASWAQANPGLGIRISAEHVEREARSMDRRTFAVERLCVGDWPRTDGLVNIVISQERWAELVDEVSAPRDPVVFTLDITPDRRRSAIAVAGKRTDELLHVEIVEHRAGTGWVVERLVELVAKHQPLAVLCDGVSPAASLVRELKQAGIEIQTLDGRQHAQACGMFYDAVEQGKLRHLGTPELAAAIRGAAQRPLGDAWAWSRKNSQTDISPLVACTLGVWGVVSLDAARPLVAFA